MKSAGETSAAFGMVPAQQGFAAAHFVVRKPHERLIVQLELVVGERLSQIDFQRAPHLHARIHLGLEIAEGAAPFGLGSIERHVRAFQQLIDVGSVIGSQRDANADVHDDLMAMQIVECPGHGVAKFLCKHRGVRRLLQSGLDDRELVAAQPCENIDVSNATAHPLGHGLEQLVAGRVTERVVDALEMIEIEIQDRQLSASADK